MLAADLANLQTWPHGGHRVGHLPRHRLRRPLPAHDEVGDERTEDGDDPAAEVGGRRVERVALDVEVQDVGQVRGQLGQEDVVPKILEECRLYVLYSDYTDSAYQIF